MEFNVGDRVRYVGDGVWASEWIGRTGVIEADPAEINLSKSGQVQVAWDDWDGTWREERSAWPYKWNLELIKENA